MLWNLLCLKLMQLPRFSFELVLVEDIFLSPFAFTLYVSLYWQWASCGQHVLLGFVFWFTDNLCFLISIFRTLTFKVIVDVVALVCTTFVFCLLLLFFVFIFVLHSFYSFCGCSCDYPDSIFSPFLAYQLVFFTLFSGCSRLCNVHLPLIQVNFQITLYSFTGSITTL